MRRLAAFAIFPRFPPKSCPVLEREEYLLENLQPDELCELFQVIPAAAVAAQTVGTVSGTQGGWEE